MTATTAANEYERKLLANIDEHGWQCTHVFGDKEGPGFSYSIGLFKSFGHPELIIFGLPQAVSHEIIGTAAAAAAAGTPIDLQAPSDALIDRYSCVFVQVPEAEYDNYVLSDCWYYQGHAFPVFQIVWPSAEGHFPWHLAVPDSFRSAQPVLGVPSRGT